MTEFIAVPPADVTVTATAVEFVFSLAGTELLPALAIVADDGKIYQFNLPRTAFDQLVAQVDHVCDLDDMDAWSIRQALINETFGAIVTGGQVPPCP